MESDFKIYALPDGKFEASVTDDGITVTAPVLLDTQACSVAEMKAYFRVSVVPELLKKMRRAQREAKGEADA